MKTLKSLREELRAFNLDTDEELDLDSLADIDIEALLGDGFMDSEDTTVDSLDSNDLANMSLDDYQDNNQLDTNSESSFDDINPEDNLDSEMGDMGNASEFDLNLDDYNPSESNTDDLSQNDADDIAGDDPESESEGDFDGEIRTVRGANLVYKRKMDDGNFEELWIYNVGNDIKRETQIRRAILAGTDVDPGSQESKDGSQHADTTTAGNVQFLHIAGLPQ